MDDDNFKGESSEVHVKDNRKHLYYQNDFFDFLSYGSPDHEPGKVRSINKGEKKMRNFEFESKEKVTRFSLNELCFTTSNVSLSFLLYSERDTFAYSWSGAP